MNDKTVDFKDPAQVITLLRHRGAVLATSAQSEDGMLSQLADAVAILMFVTAQGMERNVQPPRPIIATPRVMH